MKRACTQFWDEVFTGRFHIEVEGWHLAFFNDCCELDYCDQCISPDGRRWSFESVVRDGVEPFFAGHLGTGFAGAASSTTVSRAPPSPLPLLARLSNLPSKPVNLTGTWTPPSNFKNQWVRA